MNTIQLTDLQKQELTIKYAQLQAQKQKESFARAKREEAELNYSSLLAVIAECHKITIDEIQNLDLDNGVVEIKNKEVQNAVDATGNI
jgi:hypothetical protein